MQLFTKDKRAFIIKHDIESKEKERVATVSMIVKEKDTGKQVLSLFKSALLDLQNP